MFPWCCEIKALHPCRALRGQIPGSLKAAACLIRSPYRAAQRHPFLSAQDLFFNKNDQDGSPCSTLRCAAGMVICKLSLVSVCVSNLEQAELPYCSESSPQPCGSDSLWVQRAVAGLIMQIWIFKWCVFIAFCFPTQTPPLGSPRCRSSLPGSFMGYQPSSEDAAWLFW